MGKLEISVRVLAWIELAFTILQISTGIYVLVVISHAIKEAKPKTPVPVKTDDMKWMVNGIAVIAIKLTYVVILFFITEVVLTCFLLRALYHKRLNDLRIWMIAAMVYTVLYLTDFISTLHVMFLYENISVTIGIFIKIPLLILVHRYYSILSQDNGENLINQV